MQKNEKRYRKWLVDQVNIFGDRDYTDLLCVLYDIEYYSIVKYDEDRGMDGVALRDSWMDEVGVRVDANWGNVNVLEVLVGIAKRMEFQLWGSRYMDEWNYQKLFWDLINNLGLSGMSGTLEKDDCDTIFIFVTDFLDRCYTFGNIFVTQEGVRSMRKMNIWAQMMLYLREKWPI